MDPAREHVSRGQPAVSGRLYQAARTAFLEMILSGITTVGEFHYVHHDPGGSPYGDRNLLAGQVLRAAEDAGCESPCWGPLTCARWNKPPDPGATRFLTPGVEDFVADTEALRSAIRRTSPRDRAWVAIAPHSLRAVPLDYLREVIGYCAREPSAGAHARG